MKAQFARSSREHILRLCRSASRSVNDLAAFLDITDNAVRATLARLERDGLVRKTGKRPGVRKPESVYGITPEGDRLFARAYAPMLESLLDVLKAQQDQKEMDIKLRETGRRLAAPYLASMKGFALKERAEKALQILEDFGGLAEFERRNSRAFVIGFSCPFSEIVAKHPKLCLVVQSLVQELLGRDVHEQCQRGDRPMCRFMMDG